jgi:hypothetical protein
VLFLYIGHLSSGSDQTLKNGFYTGIVGLDSCRGTGPSPRSKHVAAMYDDRFLLIFGGASKSKPLNDIYALDFETVRDFSSI